MSLPMRIITGINFPTAEPPNTVIVESNFVLILASLLCALICVLGLIALTGCRCRIRSRRSISGPSPSSTAQSPANKGTKKKILQSLPKRTYTDAGNGNLSDCAICLTEFAVGDEIKVLPQCGHVFHVGCVDTWLGSPSSCPSCRQILVLVRCQKCGGIPENSGNVTDTDAGSTI